MSTSTITFRPSTAIADKLPEANRSAVIRQALELWLDLELTTAKAHDLRESVRLAGSTDRVRTIAGNAGKGQ